MLAISRSRIAVAAGIASSKRTEDLETFEILPRIFLGEFHHVGYTLVV